MDSNSFTLPPKSTSVGIMSPQNPDTKNEKFFSLPCTTTSSLHHTPSLLPKPPDPAERQNVFKSRLTINNKVCDFIIDNGSDGNMISLCLVKALGLPTYDHPCPYNLGRISDKSELAVRQQCIFSFSIGFHYRDSLCCDIVDMENCHLILGQPWILDVDAAHKSHQNTYEFRWHKKLVILVPLQEYLPGKEKVDNVKPKDADQTAAKEELDDKNAPTKSTSIVEKHEVSRPLNSSTYDHPISGSSTLNAPDPSREIEDLKNPSVGGSDEATSTPLTPKTAASKNCCSGAPCTDSTCLDEPIDVLSATIIVDRDDTDQVFEDNEESPSSSNQEMIFSGLLESSYSTSNSTIHEETVMSDSYSEALLDSIQEIQQVADGSCVPGKSDELQSCEENTLRTEDVPSSSLQDLLARNKDLVEHESGSRDSLKNTTSDFVMNIEDDYSSATVVTQSTQICRMALLEDDIEDAKSNKQYFVLEVGAEFLESNTALSTQQEKRLKQMGATVRNASSFLERLKMNEEREKIVMEDGLVASIQKILPRPIVSSLGLSPHNLEIITSFWFYSRNQWDYVHHVYDTTSLKGFSHTRLVMFSEEVHRTLVLDTLSISSAIVILCVDLANFITSLHIYDGVSIYYHHEDERGKIVQVITWSNAFEANCFIRRDVGSFINLKDKVVVSVMKVDTTLLESYAYICGLKAQIQVIIKAIEQFKLQKQFTSSWFSSGNQADEAHHVLDIIPLPVFSPTRWFLFNDEVNRTLVLVTQHSSTTKLNFCDVSAKKLKVDFSVEYYVVFMVFFIKLKDDGRCRNFLHSYTLLMLLQISWHRTSPNIFGSMVLICLLQISNNSSAKWKLRIALVKSLFVVPPIFSFLIGPGRTFSKDFKVGDLVISKQRTSVGQFKKFSQRQCGPFKILTTITDNANVIDLLLDFYISNTFNVADIYPFYPDGPIYDETNLRASCSTAGEYDGDHPSSGPLDQSTIGPNGQISELE